MPRAEKQITVPRPGPAVWAFLADIGHVSTWIPAVRSVEHVSGTPGTVGAEYEARVDVGGATRSGRLTITRLDPPIGMAIRVAAAPLHIDGTVTIDDRGDHSLVAVVLDAPTGGLLRLLDGPIRQALDDTLAELPRLADAVPEV